MSKGHTLETVYRIYNDDDGDYVQVGPDGDRLGLIDMRYFDEKGQSPFGAHITVSRAAARLLAEALIAAANHPPKSVNPDSSVP